MGQVVSAASDLYNSYLSPDEDGPESERDRITRQNTYYNLHYSRYESLDGEGERTYVPKTVEDANIRQTKSNHAKRDKRIKRSVVFDIVMIHHIPPPVEPLGPQHIDRSSIAFYSDMVYSQIKQQHPDFDFSVPAQYEPFQTLNFSSTTSDQLDSTTSFAEQQQLDTFLDTPPPSTAIEYTSSFPLSTSSVLPTSANYHPSTACRQELIPIFHESRLLLSDLPEGHHLDDSTQPSPASTPSTSQDVEKSNPQVTSDTSPDAVSARSDPQPQDEPHPPQPQPQPQPDSTPQPTKPRPRTLPCLVYSLRDQFPSFYSSQSCSALTQPPPSLPSLQQQPQPQQQLPHESNSHSPTPSPSVAALTAISTSSTKPSSGAKATIVTTPTVTLASKKKGHAFTPSATNVTSPSPLLPTTPTKLAPQPIIMDPQQQPPQLSTTPTKRAPSTLLATSSTPTKSTALTPRAYVLSSNSTTKGNVIKQTISTTTSERIGQLTISPPPQHLDIPESTPLSLQTPFHLPSPPVHQGEEFFSPFPHNDDHDSDATAELPRSNPDSSLPPPTSPLISTTTTTTDLSDIDQDNNPTGSVLVEPPQLSPSPTPTTATRRSSISSNNSSTIPTSTVHAIPPQPFDLSLLFSKVKPQPPSPSIKSLLPGNSNAVKKKKTLLPQSTLLSSLLALSITYYALYLDLTPSNDSSASSHPSSPDISRLESDSLHIFQSFDVPTFFSLLQQRIVQLLESKHILELLLSKAQHHHISQYHRFLHHQMKQQRDAQSQPINVSHKKLKSVPTSLPGGPRPAVYPFPALRDASSVLASSTLPHITSIEMTETIDSINELLQAHAIAATTPPISDEPQALPSHQHRGSLYGLRSTTFSSVTDLHISKLVTNLFSMVLGQAKSTPLHLWKFSPYLLQHVISNLKETLDNEQHTPQQQPTSPLYITSMLKHEFPPISQFELLFVHNSGLLSADVLYSELLCIIVSDMIELFLDAKDHN